MRAVGQGAVPRAFTGATSHVDRWREHVETADVLDLRHRLPRLWAAVYDMRLEAWVARKVARMSRSLARDDVELVDVAIAAAVDQSPSRILALAEAKVIEAEPDAHRVRLAEDAAQVGVRLSQPRPGTAIDPVDGEPATRRVALKLSQGTALHFNHTVELITDALHDQLSLEERETRHARRAPGQGHRDARQPRRRSGVPRPGQRPGRG